MYSTRRRHTRPPSTPGAEISSGFHAITGNHLVGEDVRRGGGDHQRLEILQVDIPAVLIFKESAEVISGHLVSP